MKRIKNLTLGILGATVLSLSLISCNNDDTMIEDATTEQTTMAGKLVSNEEIMNYDYEEIGILHNQGLEYVYNRLAANAPLNDSYIMYQSQSFLINSIGDFLEINGIGNNSDNVSIIQKYTLTNNDFLSLNARKNYFNSFESYKSELNNEALNISNEIDNKIDNFDVENGSITKYKNELRGKVSDINQSLKENKISQDEYIILRTKLSVAIHSGDYWNSNLKSWANLVNISENQPSSWFGRWWRKTAKIDAEGAANGWRDSDKTGKDRVNDGLDAGIASSASAALIMVIDKIGGQDSTN